jgi:hypothetical protein
MRVRSILAVTAALLGGTVLAAPAALAQDPIPIGPNQPFIGLVNGVHTGAIIKVVCPVPITPGELTHPLPGQTVEVEPGSLVTPGGYTGSLAHSIAVSFTSPVVTPPIVLTSYYVPTAIPTSILVPCSGPGVVTFNPEPTSPTAVPDHVDVTFANVGS